MPLTRGHFLVGDPLVLVPEAKVEEASIRMVQNFSRRCSREYLAQPQNRYKWKFSTNEPKVGDVVIVKKDDLPRSRWLYGFILEKHPGLDNFTRVVSLRCKDKIIKRSVSKIIILPIAT